MARFVFSTGALTSAMNAQLVDVAQHLSDLGHTTVIATFGRHEAPSDPRPVLVPEGGFTVVRWPTLQATSAADGAFFWRLLGHVRPHCVVGQFASVNWAMTLAYLRRTPTRIAWYHTLMVQSADDFRGSSVNWHLRLARRRLVYRCATRVVSSSLAGIEELVERYGVSQDLCTLHPNGIRRPASNGVGPASDVQIVSIGRLVPSKGHRYLIEAHARLHERGYDSRLVILGDGPERPALEAEACRLGTWDKVSFRGKVPHEETMSELQRSTVLCHPSLSDNTPSVLIEAMGLGIPIVATRVGGVAETVEHQVQGLLVPPADPDQLEDALVALLCDEDRRERLGAAGTERFAERYDRKRWVPRIAEWLLSEVGRSVQRSG